MTPPFARLSTTCRTARIRISALISSLLPRRSIKVNITEVRFAVRRCLGALWRWRFPGKCLSTQSSTLVIAYLIKFKNMSFLNALKLCKSKRPQVCPNLGFELQLKAYEKMLQTTSLVMEHKKKSSNELPELTKYQPFSTFNKAFLRETTGRQSNSTLSKSVRPSETREKREVELLRKMA